MADRLVSIDTTKTAGTQLPTPVASEVDVVMAAKLGNTGAASYAAAVTLAKSVVVPVPINYTFPTAAVSVSASNRAHVARSLTQARMRVAGAPSGSALTVQVQSNSTGSWVTIGTLQINAGSTTENVITLTSTQNVNDLLRLNITSVGSGTAATGVAVEIVWAPS